MALDGELRVLLAVKDHLDGLADLVLRHQQSAAEHVGEMLLAAERAAGRALADDDIVIGNVQQSRDGLADVERALGGGIEDELAVLHVRDGAVGLQMDVLLIGAFRWSPQRPRPPRRTPRPSAGLFRRTAHT